MDICPIRPETILSFRRQEAALNRLKIIKLITLIVQVTLICFIKLRLFLVGSTFTSLLLLPIIPFIIDVKSATQNIEQLVKNPGMMASHPDGYVFDVHTSSQDLINHVGKETIFLGSLMNFLDQDLCFEKITNLLTRLHKL